jgi:hypothetical protein
MLKTYNIINNGGIFLSLRFSSFPSILLIIANAPNAIAGGIKTMMQQETSSIPKPEKSKAFIPFYLEALTCQNLYQSDLTEKHAR